MGKRPNLKEIEQMLFSGNEFTLSESLYKEITGIELPKNMSYLKNSSALARLARDNGYLIELAERTVILKRA